MGKNLERIKEAIEQGNTFLGIELGSTRIKAVLIDESYSPIAQGGFDWENSLLDGIWTYSLEDVWQGVQQSFIELKKDVSGRYGTDLAQISSIGVSAMMHGYIIFDKDDKLLTPFRTWRNTMTDEAVKILTDKFQFNIPQRWSVAHLYQAILNGEKNVQDISFMTTLAGYVHWKLTGEKVLGIGDASGMFPIYSGDNDYNKRMLDQFDSLIKNQGFNWKINEILPKVLNAGENAGSLTAEGAKLLDPTGELNAGIPLCPPEGDAGTGMVATNSVAPLTGNVSAGTSIFAMLVLEKELSRVYPEIDMVTTPNGKPVAMVHCNNFSSDIDAWVNMFGETLESFGEKASKSKLYDVLYNKALEGDVDCGGLLCYNYFSGEHITGFEEGRPLLVRTPDSSFNLKNLMRSLIFSAMATLKIGMNILADNEKVHLKELMGHGGFFKTPIVGQRLMASAMDIPVSVMSSAGEGGAWGIALLAAFMTKVAENKSLEAFLGNKVFTHNIGERILPNEADKKSFDIFIEKYIAGLEIERAAIYNFK